MSTSTTSQTADTAATLTGQADVLRSKLQDKTAVIGVVGLGYVGLPLAVEFALKGFRTVGIELNREKVLRLNAADNYIQDVPDADLKQALDSGKFVAEDDFASSGDIDVFFICVPTPVTEYKDPDVSYIRSATESIAEHFRPGQMLILKSTTYPDTTEGVVQPILEEAGEAEGLTIGEDYFLAFSPERIDPGNLEFTTANTPVVVGGVTPACTELASLAMKQVVGMVHEVSSPKVAEMEKLLENIFRSVNIALVSELARLCDRMGNVSIWEVVEAAGTKPFGFMPFYPGPGIGGHCIPIDPYYLSWLARRYDFETSFITLAASTNEAMPFYVVESVMRAIADQPVRLSDAKVLILGTSFKKDVDDVRHSPALRVIELLRDQGVNHVSYSDPHVARLSVKTHRHGTLELENTPLSEDILKGHDVAVLLTEHSDFDYETIAKHARVVIDTRNGMKQAANGRDNVRLLGGGAF